VGSQGGQGAQDIASIGPLIDQDIDMYEDYARFDRLGRARGRPENPHNAVNWCDRLLLTVAPPALIFRVH
jgi:hypothetical protein